MRGNLNVIFFVWEFEKNEGEIIGMNMDLFCITEIYKWKWDLLGI